MLWQQLEPRYLPPLRGDAHRHAARHIVVHLLEVLEHVCRKKKKKKKNEAGKGGTESQKGKA